MPIFVYRVLSGPTLSISTTPSYVTSSKMWVFLTVVL